VVNATIQKFGYPATLVRDFEHWLLLLRPGQVTLGSLVLAARSEVTAYGALPPGAFSEQGLVVAAIEQALSTFTRYERINYLMLMMVDPHVHFHVVPRYAGGRTWKGMHFADAGWPAAPDLKTAITLGEEQIGLMAQELTALF
jgi:diadenosine tetraphosphate (Ap4A) HIT family hydrolase